MPMIIFRLPFVYSMAIETIETIAISLLQKPTWWNR